MRRCNIYYSYTTLWQYAKTALKNTLDQAVGVLKHAVKGSTTGVTKILYILVKENGLRKILRNCLNITVNMPSKDGRNCGNGKRNIDKILFSRLKIKLEAEQEKLSKYLMVNFAKFALLNQLQKEITGITANLSKLCLYVGSVTSTSVEAIYLLSNSIRWTNGHAAIYDNGAVQHLMIIRGKYKLGDGDAKS